MCVYSGIVVTGLWGSPRLTCTHATAAVVVPAQVLVDVPRTCPKLPAFHTDFVQRSLERVLFIWAMRHPASGYVQGINDIVTPFYTVMFEERGIILDAKRVAASDDGEDGSGDAASAVTATCTAALERLGDDALMEVEADVCVACLARAPVSWPAVYARDNMVTMCCCATRDAVPRSSTAGTGAWRTS